MKKRFIDHKFAAGTLKVIEQANDIIESYVEQGLRLTLRQLYYQFVTKNWIANSDKEYKRLADIISKGRLAGLIDWAAIEDRGRVPDIPAEWDNVEGVVNSAIYSYRRRRWAGQRNVVELWVEKQALAGVLEPMAERFHITLSVNKGYSSSSAMYEAANRISGRCFARDPGAPPGVFKHPYVLYLGDHDPSGEDMVRDISERLNLFKLSGSPTIVVEKIALTMDQIEQYSPPPNPAKRTDSRYQKYAEQHGSESWEVDALPPNVLQGIISRRVESLIDRRTMDGVIALETEEKEALRRAAKMISIGSSTPDSGEDEEDDDELDDPEGEEEEEDDTDE